MASGRFIHYIDKQYHNYIVIDWKSSPITGENASNVTASVSVYRTYRIYESYNHPVTITINGSSKTATQHSWNGVGSTGTIVTHTVKVPHNADGNRTVAISCNLDFNVCYSGVWYWSVSTGSLYAKLDKLANKSSFSITNSDGVKLGETLGIKLKRSSNLVRHSITGSVGNYTFPILAKASDDGSATDYSYVLDPDEFLPYMDTAAKTLKVTLTTYNGNSSLGTSSASTIVSIRDTDKPTINPSSVTITPVPIEPNTATDVFIQGKSKAKVSIIPILAGGDGGLISSYYITLNSVRKVYPALEKKEQNSYIIRDFILDGLTIPGENTITVQAVDVRGQISNVATKTISVLPYSNPQISSFSVSRCLQDGTLNKSGTYVKVSASLILGSVGYNTGTAVLYKKGRLEADSVYAKLEEWSFDKNTAIEKVYGPYSADESYDFKFTIADKYGATGYSIAEVGTEELLMDFSENSVAVGKVCERENAFECLYPAYFEDTIYGTVSAYSSDIRYKTILKDSIEDLVPLWKDINIILFKYNNSTDEKIFTGVIAQELIKLFEKHKMNWRDYALVLGSEEEGYSVNYEFLNRITMYVLSQTQDKLLKLELRIKALEEK